MTSNKINPPHYDGDACMRKIADLTKEMPGTTAFCVGQAVKYLWRTDRKPGESSDHDRAKAIWYLDWIEGYEDYFNENEVRIIASLRSIATEDPTVRRERVKQLR